MCISIAFSFVNVINVSMCKHVDSLAYFSAQMLSRLVKVSRKTTQHVPETLEHIPACNRFCCRFVVQRAEM